MIGERKAGPKTGALGVLAQLKGRLPKDRGSGASAEAKNEATWNALKAAKEAEAARRKFELENYNVMLRRV